MSIEQLKPGVLVRLIPFWYLSSFSEGETTGLAQGLACGVIQHTLFSAEFIIILKALNSW